MTPRFFFSYPFSQAPESEGQRASGLEGAISQPPPDATETSTNLEAAAIVRCFQCPKPNPSRFLLFLI